MRALSMMTMNVLWRFRRKDFKTALMIDQAMLTARHIGLPQAHASLIEHGIANETVKRLLSMPNACRRAGTVDTLSVRKQEP